MKSSNGSLQPRLSIVNVSIASIAEWNFMNLHVAIKRSKLWLTRLKGQNSGIQTLKFYVFKSTFGSLLLVGKHNATVADSSFDIRSQHPHPTIEMSDGQLQIKNCNFTGKSNSSLSAILKATFSKIVVENVHAKKIVASNGLIMVKNHSHIALNSVTFGDNGAYSVKSTVAVLEKSSVHVTNSLFENNKASFGACFYIGRYSELFATNTYFIGNIAVGSGGGIYSESNTVLKLELCEFSNNSAWFIEKDTEPKAAINAGGGAIFTESSAGIYLYQSTFFNNSCVNYKNMRLDPAQNYGSTLHNLLEDIYFGDNSLLQLQVPQKCQGGAIHTSTAKLEIHNSTFSNNYADYGGSALALGANSNLTTNSSIFDNNSGSPHTGAVQCQSCDCKIINSTFPHNVGVFVIEQSNLTILGSQFHHNTGYLIVKCANTNLLLESSNFWHNGATNGKYTQTLERAGENGRYEDDTLVSAEGTSTVLIKQCNFTNNVLSYIVRTKSGVLLRIGYSHFQSNIACIIQLSHEVELKMNNCFLGNNSVLDDAVISCESCYSITLLTATFSDNDARDQAAVVKVKSKSSVLLRAADCTFANNRHGVFVGSHMRLNINSSTFLFSKWNFEDTQYNMLDLERSNVTFVDSFCDIYPVAYIQINLKMFSQMTFLNTTIKGFIVFVIEQSHLGIMNCSLLEESINAALSSDGQIQLKQSSVLNIQHTTVNQGQFCFIISEASSAIFIANCSFNFTSSTTQIAIENTQLEMSSTHVYWEKVLLIRPRSKTSYLITTMGCEVHIKESHFGVANKKFLLRFVSSNATLDNSVFQAGKIVFMNGQSNFLLINNNTRQSGSSFLIMGGVQNVVVNSSVVFMDIGSQDQHSTDTLRLYMSRIFTSHHLHKVNRLFTWRSRINMVNISFETNGTHLPFALRNFMRLGTHSCNKFVMDNRTLPLLSETKFAAGTWTGLNIVVLFVSLFFSVCFV